MGYVTNWIQELTVFTSKFYYELMRKPAEWQYTRRIWVVYLFANIHGRYSFSQIISSLWKGRNNKIWFQTKKDVIARPDGIAMKRFEPRRIDNRELYSVYKVRALSEPDQVCVHEYFLSSKLCENEIEHSILTSRFKKSILFLLYLIYFVYFRAEFLDCPQNTLCSPTPTLVFDIKSVVYSLKGNRGFPPSLPPSLSKNVTMKYRRTVMNTRSI